MHFGPRRRRRRRWRCDGDGVLRTIFLYYSLMRKQKKKTAHNGAIVMEEWREIRLSNEIHKFRQPITISVPPFLSGVHDPFRLLIVSSWQFPITYQEFMTISVYLSIVHDDFRLLIRCLWRFLFTYLEFMMMFVYLSGIHDDFRSLIGSSWWILSTKWFMFVWIF